MRFIVQMTFISPKLPLMLNKKRERERKKRQKEMKVKHLQDHKCDSGKFLGTAQIYYAK